MKFLGGNECYEGGMNALSPERTAFCTEELARYDKCHFRKGIAIASFLRFLLVLRLIRRPGS